MKKLIIVIVTLVVLAGGSISAFLIVKNNQDEKKRIEAENQRENILFSFNSDDVTAVEIDCPDGQYIAENIEESWQFTNTDEFLANQDYIINVITYMSSLEAKKSYGSSKDADLEKYGLDSPITVTCRTQEENHTIYIGNPTPTNEGFYCMIEGKEKIYSIDYSYGSVLYANKNMLKSQYMINYDTDEITAFELIRQNETIYNIEKDSDGIWHFIGEYDKLQVDNSSISAMLSVLTRLKAEQFIEENLDDYSKYGFDSPYAQIKITGSDGKTHSLLFSKYGDDADYTHVLIEDSGQVSTYYTSDVDYIDETFLNVVINQIYYTHMSTVTGLDISYEKGDINIGMDYNNLKYSVNGEDVSEYGEDVINNLYTMYSKLSSLQFSDVDYDAEVSGEPEIIVTYHLSDNTQTIMEFIPVNDDQYWLMINDTYTGFILNKNNVSGNYSFIYWYEKLLTSIKEFKL